MDECGIGRAMLSVSSPGVHFGSDNAAAELAREMNQYAAAQTRTHPERFGSFACLPMSDVDASLAEARYAMDQLGANGIVLMSNVQGVYLGDKRFWPLWQELDQRHAVVFIHPTAPAGGEAIRLGRPYPMIEFVFDEARTVVDLLFAGVLLDFPNIRFMISHSGGAMPVILERISLFYETQSAADGRSHARSVGSQVSQLWFDCAGTPLPTALPTLASVVGSGRLLYGSDYCFTSPSAVARQVKSLRAVGDRGRWLPLMANNASQLLARDARH